jgi:hypothetical protein
MTGPCNHAARAGDEVTLKVLKLSQASLPRIVSSGRSVGGSNDECLDVNEFIALDATLPLCPSTTSGGYRRLIRGVRGAHKQPGEIRRSQNWIGGTRPGNAVFVPAPSEELPALLADLENYLHAENGLPPLVRIGLAHVQFETIHPYPDGNGRNGRLLISLLLDHLQQLSAALLYLNLFFKRHRAEYYRLLGEVRRSGDREAWMVFFWQALPRLRTRPSILPERFSR